MDIIQGTDTYEDGKLGAIRNPDGIWINSSVFREEANNFKKHGYYCADPEGSPDWERYWTEQRRRMKYGYSVGGVRVTGDHYAYLNFFPILKVDEDKAGEVKNRGRAVRKGSKETDFADFWDGDYNYFWSREIARNGILDSGLITSEEADEIYHLEDTEQVARAVALFESLHLEVVIEPDYLFGGWNMIVGKARQRGYSFKNAAIGVTNYLTRPNAMTIFGAEDKKFLYPKGIFTMANSYLNFIGQHTPWLYPRDVINQASKGHLRASTLEMKNGVPIETGFMSELYSATFHNDADAARGKTGVYDLFFEESGSFGTPGLLKDSYKASEDCVMSGDIKTGMITIFGTSGDMEGGTADYAEMHENPLRFGLLPFKDTWSKDSPDAAHHNPDSKCGFFHPIHWNMQGYYDVQGNSDKEGALRAELAIRKLRQDNGATSADLQKRMQEKPITPFEAFGMTSTNNFPILELKKQLEIVKANNLHMTKGTPVNLSYDYINKRVIAEPILDGSAAPIYRMKPETTSWRGCPIIFEYPAEQPVPGAYKIGYDPYRQDKGSSLAAIYVYKSVIWGHTTKRVIVAEYVGRPSESDDVNNIARLFAELYNTTIMHENDVTQVKDYFRRRKLLKFLAYQPDEVISKHVKKSKVARVYGCHMIDQLKDAGEKYIKDWLTQVHDYDENGHPVRAIDRIYSIGLLEELIAYNRKGNFDRVMALMQVMFQDQEDMLGTTYAGKATVNKKVEQLANMSKKMYPKNNNRGLSHTLI